MAMPLAGVTSGPWTAAMLRAPRASIRTDSPAAGPVAGGIIPRLRSAASTTVTDLRTCRRISACTAKTPPGPRTGRVPGLRIAAELIGSTESGCASPLRETTCGKEGEFGAAHAGDVVDVRASGVGLDDAAGDDRANRSERREPRVNGRFNPGNGRHLWQGKEPVGAYGRPTPERCDADRLTARMALRFRTTVAEVQVRAVSVFLRFDGRGGTRLFLGRVHTNDKELVKQEKSRRMAVIAATGAVPTDSTRPASGQPCCTGARSLVISRTCKQSAL